MRIVKQSGLDMVLKEMKVDIISSLRYLTMMNLIVTFTLMMIVGVEGRNIKAGIMIFLF